MLFLAFCLKRHRKLVIKLGKIIYSHCILWVKPSVLCTGAALWLKGTSAPKWQRQWHCSVPSPSPFSPALRFYRCVTYTAEPGRYVFHRQCVENDSHHIISSGTAVILWCARLLFAGKNWRCVKTPVGRWMDIHALCFLISVCFCIVWALEGELLVLGFFCLF